MTATETLEALRADSLAPGDTLADWMEQTAKRFKVLDGTEIDTTTHEAFLAGLRAAGAVHATDPTWLV